MTTQATQETLIAGINLIYPHILNLVFHIQWRHLVTTYLCGRERELSGTLKYE